MKLFGTNRGGPGARHHTVLGDNLLVADRWTSLLAMLDWNQCSAVERSPDKVSGAWVFRGTRVPVQALFANLEEGARLDDFLEWFPGVTREQAEAVLNAS